MKEWNLSIRHPYESWRRDTPRRQERDPAQQKENKMDNNDKTSAVKKIVARAIKRTKKNAPRITVYYDDLFHTANVYAYCTFEEFNALQEALFDERHRIPPTAKGCRAFQNAKKGVAGKMCLVWVSSELPVNSAIPAFLRDLVSLSQELLNYIRAMDISGEVQAYFVEREYARIVRELMGKKVDENFRAENVESRIREAISEKGKNGEKGKARNEVEFPMQTALSLVEAIPCQPQRRKQP